MDGRRAFAGEFEVHNPPTCPDQIEHADQCWEAVPRQIRFHTDLDRFGPLVSHDWRLVEVMLQGTPGGVSLGVLFSLPVDPCAFLEPGPLQPEERLEPLDCE